VLSFSQTVAGFGCPTESTAKELTELITNYFNAGAFDGNELTEESQEFSGGTDPDVPKTAAVTFDVNFHLPIIVKCDHKKHGKFPVPFTIFGNHYLDVKQIDLSSLSFAGTPTPPDGLKCLKPFDVNKDTFRDLSCIVDSCPDLGPALKALRDPHNKKVVVPVTGLIEGGTAIFGEDPSVKTLP